MDDDEFRRRLIVALDQRHFSVSFFADGESAFKVFQEKRFQVVILALDIASGKGVDTLKRFGEPCKQSRAALVVLGEPHPDLRMHAHCAKETLLRPVDAVYVAERARAYC